MSFHVPLAKLAQGPEKAQVNYCVLHGWQSLAETIDSDIDIVVAPEHLNRFEQVLNLELGGRIVQLLQYETSGFYFVVARLDEAIRFTAATTSGSPAHEQNTYTCSPRKFAKGWYPLTKGRASSNYKRFWELMLSRQRKRF